MTSARDIAISAAQQAIDAAEREKAERVAVEQAEQLRQQQNAEHTFELAKAVLGEWFPGVEWIVVDTRSGIGTAMGYGDGNTVIVMDATATGKDDMRLGVQRKFDRETRQHTDEVQVYMVSEGYDRDSMSHYWGGGEVTSPTQIGQALIARQQHAEQERVNEERRAAR